MLALSFEFCITGILMLSTIICRCRCLRPSMYTLDVRWTVGCWSSRCRRFIITAGSSCRRSHTLTICIAHRVQPAGLFVFSSMSAVMNRPGILNLLSDCANSICGDECTVFHVQRRTGCFSRIQCKPTFQDFSPHTQPYCGRDQPMISLH